MRLTYRDSTVPHTNAKGELWEAYSDANYNEIINKLAAYEDTGIEPEEIEDRLVEVQEMSGIYIPGMTEEEYTELCAWARVGANNCYLGRKKCIPVPDHGILVDADALCKLCNNSIDHSVTPNDIMRMPIIIPADKDGVE